MQQLLQKLGVIGFIAGCALAMVPGTAFAVDADCPDLGWARSNLHSDVTLKGEEPCAYHMLRNDGSYSALVNYPWEWVVDAAEPDGLVYTQYGDGRQQWVKGATWRRIRNYPGMTLPRHYQDLLAYASLPQNNFAHVVRCRWTVAASC